MQMFTPPPEADSAVTVLQGHVSDQAELAGILNTLYELHLPLLSVQHLGD
jgi:16S rRNA A1518/A1519 N6-dimethyltransferase RsmA/KsgA/DIM1 with predicted DNA glycosylase/AP lyase activity